MRKFKIASFKDMIRAVAELLADEWQTINKEPFINSSKFPSEMGNMLAEELYNIQKRKPK